MDQVQQYAPQPQGSFSYSPKNGGIFSPKPENLLFGGLASLAGGLFGNSGSPYQDAMDQYQKYFDEAKKVQNPFYKAGVNALPAYNNWLGSQSNPSEFINNLMSQYHQSPWAKFQMNQGTNAANNAASANGLIGSTPLGQANADYSRNISSQDQNQWLSHVLGINNNYGQGQQNLANMGQNSANYLTQLLSNFGQNMGEQSYNKGAAENNDFSNILGGLGSIGGFLYGV